MYAATVTDQDQGLLQRSVLELYLRRFLPLSNEPLYFAQVCSQEGSLHSICLPLVQDMIYNHWVGGCHNLEAEYSSWLVSSFRYMRMQELLHLSLDQRHCSEPAHLHAGRALNLEGSSERFMILEAIAEGPRHGLWSHCIPCSLTSRRV